MRAIQLLVQYLCAVGRQTNGGAGPAPKEVWIAVATVRSHAPQLEQQFLEQITQSYPEDILAQETVEAAVRHGLALLLRRAQA